MSAVEQTFADPRNPPAREMSLFLVELFVFRDSDGERLFLDQCEFTDLNQLIGDFPWDLGGEVVIQLQDC